jgi:putative endonuclease
VVDEGFGSPGRDSDGVQHGGCLQRHPEQSEGSAHPWLPSDGVYILASKTRRLYVGVTGDLVRRVWEHKTGLVAGFTRRYGIDRLVYFEIIKEALTGIQREKQIKSYARVKKLALIASMNPDWADLAEPWYANVARADPSLRSG